MPGLTPAEIRARAAVFAEDWKDARYEKGETQSFYNDFFSVFGVNRRKVASFEEPVRKLDGRIGFIDLFWKGVLLVEHKSAGRDLTKARTQAFDYFPNLKDAELPQFVLACDFQNFELIDLETREEVRFPLRRLPEFVERFDFILGRKVRPFREQDPVNDKAASAVGQIHKEFEKANYKGHNLERFLVRVVFCLFADDAGIFEPRDIFEDLIRDRSREDGSDLGALLTHLFQVLDMEDRPPTLHEDFAKFPYINGNLFAKRLDMPTFTAEMRKALLDASAFDWSEISPAIFGKLFEGVLTDADRRAEGKHYTRERDILKVVEPLFLDGLRQRLEHAKGLRNGRERALREIHDELAQIRVFDPACGCGNFLVIAYRELRQLEIDLLLELNPERQRVIDLDLLSRVDVDAMFGIELDEWPVRIAEIAVWMMDHLMNRRLAASFGLPYNRIPLKASPCIKHDDALEEDWAAFLPPRPFTYIIGNPPFGGAKKKDDDCRAQIHRLAGATNGGTLDYVAGWFIKAADYVAAVPPERGPLAFGLVATNSICQGEQAAQLWPLLWDRGMEIAFAHRTFAWEWTMKGDANVHCVIVGMRHSRQMSATRQLFTALIYFAQTTLKRPRPHPDRHNKAV